MNGKEHLSYVGPDFDKAWSDEDREVLKKIAEQDNPWDLPASLTKTHFIFDFPFPTEKDIEDWYSLQKPYMGLAEEQMTYDSCDYNGPDYGTCETCDSPIVDDQIEEVDGLMYCEDCAEEAREELEEEEDGEECPACQNHGFVPYGNGPEPSGYDECPHGCTEDDPWVANRAQLRHVASVPAQPLDDSDIPF